MKVFKWFAQVGTSDLQSGVFCKTGSPCFSQTLTDLPCFLEEKRCSSV